MNKKIKILFLYTELAEYFLACVRELLRHDVEVSIIKWPLNREAPFEFDLPANVTFYNKEKFSGKALMKLAESIEPDIVFCSGWIDKDYIKVCRQFRRKGIPVVGGVDNHWKGSLRQIAALLLSPFTIRQYFSHLWVPGKPQYKYARKLGFKESNILQGYYSADVNYFNKLYQEKRGAKSASFPHRFIYAGRYVPHKGIKDLWQAFLEISEEIPGSWELWCLGTGPLEGEKAGHPLIKHFGFIQPADMTDFIRQTGVFVLPSHFEPWGVALHEFAAAGFPLICTHEVGAATAFVEEGENGFLYKAGDIAELKEALRKIIRLSDEELIKMGDKSAEKAKAITPEKWAQALVSVADKR